MSNDHRRHVRTVPQAGRGLLRVSSEEQTEGWSLEGQEQTIREYAERQGFEIAKLYTDDRCRINSSGRV